MSTFLFAAQPSMGHLTPMLTIARQMQSEGHTIVFVCSAPAKTTKVIPANGFRLVNIQPSLYTLGFLLLPFISGYMETFMAVKLFFGGLSHYARSIGHVLDELQSDAVVADFAFTGACLAAGRPLLVMPVGGEQGDNAGRVVYLGVGLRADIRKSTSLEIGAKVNRLIEEPTFRQRAKELAKALALTEGPFTAARFIEHVAQSRRPLLRPEGYPLTVTRETVPPWEFSPTIRDRLS